MDGEYGKYEICEEFVWNNLKGAHHLEERDVNDRKTVGSRRTLSQKDVRKWTGFIWTITESTVDMFQIR
jgi:hypothetical protein